jgi:hypothetical protein
MRTKTKYEEQIINEIKGLPVSLQKKIARMVQVFREEMTGDINDEKTATARFLSACGTWKDKRTVDEQINDIYKTRKSRKEMESLK